MSGPVDCKGRPIKVGDTVVVMPKGFVIRHLFKEEYKNHPCQWLIDPVVIHSLQVISSIYLINGGIGKGPFGVHADAGSIVLIPSMDLPRKELLLYLALEGFGSVVEDSA